MIKTFILFLLLIVFSISMFGYAIPKINAWEIANNYPYGKLCDVYNNCK
jgi:hypothetical protein